jgi:PAS domain-containing protein
VPKATIARSVLVVWTLAMVVAALAVALVATSDHTSGIVTTIALAVPTGLAFVASGLVARARRPGNRTGSLLVVVGFAWFLGALPSSNEPLLFTAGILVGSVFVAWLVHLLLAFPSGRLEQRSDLVIAAAVYVLVILVQPFIYLFDARTDQLCDGPCPENLINIADKPGLAHAFEIAFVVLAALLGIALVGRLVQRWLRATPALRRALAPVFGAGLAFVVAIVVVNIVGAFSSGAAKTLNWLVLATYLSVPLAFLFGLLRWHFGSAARRLLADLSERREPEAVREALRGALRDPTLELGFPVDSGYVDVHGVQLPEAAPESARASTRLGDAIVVHDASLLDQPELLADVLDAAQIALERGLSLRSLEASDRRTSALLDAMPDNVYRVRADGTFLDAHVKHNVGVFGGAEAFVGRTIKQILPFDVAERLVEALENVLATGETARIEYELERNGGSSHIEARIVRSGEDEVVAITRDVTDLKTSEAALRELAEEQAALRRVATLAAAVGDREKERVFAAVTEEVGRLLGAQAANTTRFSADGTAVIVGAWGTPGIELFEPGAAIPLDGATC